MKCQVGKKNQQTSHWGPPLWHGGLAIPVSHNSVVQILPVLFPVYLSANMPRKAMDNGPSSWDPAICVGDLDGVTGYGIVISAWNSHDCCSHFGDWMVGGCYYLSLFLSSLPLSPFFLPVSFGPLHIKEREGRTKGR